MNRIFKQILNFFAVSGTGWLMDFSVYLILINKLMFPVKYSNMLSSIPAITFVFIVSTNKIFNNRTNGIALKKKYVIYFIYQMLLIYFVSLLGQFLYDKLRESTLFNPQNLFFSLQVFVKIMITPFTMLVNFVVMKLLAEKI